MAGLADPADDSILPLPALTDEAARMAALRELDLLDTPAEPHFDRIVRLASEILRAPMSAVTLVDEARQWFKAKVGLDVSETPRSASFCSHAIQSYSLMIVEDAEKDSRFAANPLVVGDPNIRFYAGAPLTLKDGQNIGALCVIDRVPRHLSDQQQTLLQDLAAIVVDEMELRRANQRLNQLATTDPLTGLMNRRAFFSAAKREAARVARYGGQLGMIILDIDHFKLINDTHGHEIGDHAIVELARTLAGGVRHEVLVCRLGGDEFAVCLPEADLANVELVGERLRQLAGAARFDTRIGAAGFTISLGATIHVPGETIEATLNRADEALYQSKNGGRDRVTVTAPA